MTSTASLRAVAVAACVLLALPAAAGSVFLNGVKIDGVTGQKFDKVNIRIDDKGDIYIDAPGYQVRSVEGGSEPAKTGSIPATRKYFLIAEQTAAGMAEYDIDVYVNSKWVRTVKSDEETVVAEDISKFVMQGKNTVLFSAKKKILGGTRKSMAVSHQLKLLIGEGNMGGNKVMVDTQLVKFNRTAADTDDVSQEFTFTGR
jgi:hypothetical protein